MYINFKMLPSPIAIKALFSKLSQSYLCRRRKCFQSKATCLHITFNISIKASSDNINTFLSRRLPAADKMIPNVFLMFHREFSRRQVQSLRGVLIRDQRWYATGENYFCFVLVKNNFISNYIQASSSISERLIHFNKYFITIVWLKVWAYHCEWCIPETFI